MSNLSLKEDECMQLTVEDLQEVGAQLICGDKTAPLNEIYIDSRAVTQGSTFVAFKGEKVNGNDYALAALKAGALVVILTQDATPELVCAAQQQGATLARTSGEDATDTLLDLAARWRTAHPQWIVVGVTGSVGKTTTKEMLAALIATRYKTHATKGNFNSLIGLALSILSAPDSSEVLVLEMGMDHAGELTRLSHAAHPQLVVLTNIGTSHIGILGSRRAIADAKAEIVSGMIPLNNCELLNKSNRGLTEQLQVNNTRALDTAGGQSSFDLTYPALIMTTNNDFASYIAQNFAKPAGVHTYLVGDGKGAVVKAQIKEQDEQGYPLVQIQEDLPLQASHVYEFRLARPGTKLVSNALLALAAARALGVTPQEAAQAFENLPQTHMRLEFISQPDKPRIIDDSYNASPSSMAAALDVLAQTPVEAGGRHVAVLGEVAELGSHAERLHACIGAYAAAKNPELLIFIGDKNAQVMAEAATTMGFNLAHMMIFPNAAAALDYLLVNLSLNDCVLIKASRSAGLDMVVKGLLA